jgi:hypothetical protein
MVRRTIFAGVLGLAMALGVAGAALATGQPDQECGDSGATTRPGQSASAPGSPFNEEGVAGTKYAGEQPQNSKNPISVSQYDVACSNVTQHGK